MKKAASIFLRADIRPTDVENISRWLESLSVTRYLNEDGNAPEALRRMLDTTPAPLLTCRLNQFGKIFLVCQDGDDSMGFIKLRGHSDCFEIVVAIGEERLWGNGYGTDAVRAAQYRAFFDWRAKKIIAKIYHGNIRSERMVRCCGFREEQRGESLSLYSITMDEYLRALTREKDAREMTIA